jgi:tRNA-specific 2-thiouridylase
MLQNEGTMKEKVVVGMSGGVDSSVAAYLLKEQGYDVIGVTMQIWQDQDVFERSAEGGCCGLSAVEDARRVADVLGIPYYVMNFRADFQKSVIDYFVSEYERGYTPNPCNACNRHVKWESLLHRAVEIGADYIATGHYARIEKLPNGRYSIRNSVTAAKDQTYALYNLTQEQLGRTLMPVGDYAKDQIREIARNAGLPVAAKSDSQDICFVPDHDYAGFIERETGRVAAPGNFVDEEGNVLGTHRGIIHYTIGQRKGLGISAETPLFVKELRPETNEVVLCRSERLFSDTCYVSGVNYMGIAALDGRMEVLGKIRYSHKGSPCTIEELPDGLLKCTFREPQRAMTPGQAAVFYEGDHILCGGTIER